MIARVREVLQGEGAAEPRFGAHFIPTQNISWEHCFWWLRPVEQQPSAAKQAPTCLPEGASQPGPGRKGGGVDVCVCKKRTKISVASIPGDFPFKKKKKNHNCTSILFFLPVFPRESYLFFPSFPPLQAHFFLSGTERRGRKEST